MKIHYAKAIYDNKERQAVLDVFDNGWFSGGKKTEEFENKLAKWWGVKYALSVNSGSSANFIATQALFDKGDEVITPALGFPTTTSALVYHQLKPVWIDSKLSMIMDTRELSRAITPKTKGIVFAHTLGNVCNMDTVMRLVKKHDLKVLEDCCDAMSSTWLGKKVGTYGDLATVSFYPAHHMTTFGEGGAILTNDLFLYRKCLSIRDWGRACYCKAGEDNACGHRFDNPPFDHKYYYTNLGMNLKMTEAQAAFGIVQLERVDDFVDKRRSNFKYLTHKIYHEDLILPRPLQYANPSWFSLPLLSRSKKEKWMRYLEDSGIQTRSIFAGNLTLHPAFKGIGKKHKLDNTNRIMEGGFFIGVHPDLSEEDLNYMVKVINEI